MARVDKDTRIKKILDAAEAEFLSKDYDEVTMDSIGERVKMWRMQIHREFPDKGTLLVAVSDRFYEPVWAMMARADRAEDPLDGLKKFIREYLNFWARHANVARLHFMFMSKVVGNRQLRAAISGHVLNMTERYDALLERAVESGQLPKQNTRAKATALFCALEGATTYVSSTGLLTAKTAAGRIEKAML